MKKFILAILIILVLITGLLYGLFFTGFGNGILKPMVKSRIESALNSHVTVSSFKLRPSSFKIKFKDSSGALVDLDGKFNIFSKSINAAYYIFLAENQTVTYKKLQITGPLMLKGTIKGTLNSKLNINGISNIAQSDTKYNIILDKRALADLNVTINQLHIDKLCLTLNKPIYASGLANVKIAGMGKYQTADISIVHGMISKKSIERVIDRKVNKGINFTAEMRLNAKKGKIILGNMKINSNIGRITTKVSVVNLKKDKIQSDYKIDLPNLGNLYFLINRHLKGSAVIVGNVDYENKQLIVNASSNLFGGVINARLVNNVLKGNAKGINIKGLTDMLFDKRILSSNGDLDFGYDIAAKKGFFKGSFRNGHIMQSRMTYLVRGIVGFNLTKELYKKTTIVGKIKDKLLKIDFNMASRLTKLSSKNAVLDLDKDQINAVLNLKIKSRDIVIKLKGRIEKPKIKIDTKKTIKRAIKQEIKSIIRNILK